MRGFSLVELSIVLVILGLLTGGILTGQTLIRAAELRAVTTEFQRYQGAVNTFRDKYFAIPGDMRNATAFWGVAAGTGDDAACIAASGIGALTCNGDGDGNVGIANSNTIVYETFRFWEHLSNAGLIEGSFTGIAGANSTVHGVLGENVPVSKLSNAGFSVRNLGSLPESNAGWYEDDYGNVFHFGSTTAEVHTLSAAISAEEAWNIDTKLDDGRPSYGNVMSAENPPCTTSNDKELGEYNLTDTSISCTILFKGSF